jgi:chitodextrinase
MLELPDRGSSRPRSASSDRRHPAVLRLLVSLVAVASLAVTGSALGANSVLVGSTSVQGNLDSNKPGVAEAFRAGAAATGNATSLSVYLDGRSTASRLSAGLYADNAGHPGALLATGNLATPKAGVWNTVPLAQAAAVHAGQTYWIAILAPAGAIAFRDVSGGGASETSSQSSLSALPATWSTGTRYSDGPVSAYAVADLTVDTIPPSAPTAFAASSATQTTVTMGWTASTDDVAVAGYGEYTSGNSMGSTTSTSSTASGLLCGTSYAFGVDAFDSTGNRSARTLLTASTSACTDTTPPSTPTGLAASGATQTSVTLGWTASTDNVGVTGYGVYWNGIFAGVSGTPGYTVTGLACGTRYSFAVDAADAAGNHSGKALLTASTSACPVDSTPPSTPTGLAVSAATQTSVSLGWSASTDNVGVAGYGVYKSGSLAGSGAATSYTVSGLVCGTSYPFSVDAFDAAGNHSGKALLTASTSACAGGLTANLWMSTQAGGSCVRSASPVAFNQAASCASVSAAFGSCQPADLVGVQAGSYGSQSISGVKAAPYCVFDLGITGTQASFAGFSPAQSAGGVEFRNGTISSISWNYNAGTSVPSNITFRGIASHSEIFIKGGQNLSFIGGSLTGVNETGSAPAAFHIEGCASGCGGTGTTMSNVLVDGYTINGNKQTCTTCHYELIRIDENASYVTIRNTRFFNNSITDCTSFIFITSTSGAGPPHNLTFENNYFGLPQTGCYYVFQTQATNIPVCDHFNLRYNSFAFSAWADSCSSNNGSTFKGNVAPRDWKCAGGLTASYNVWQWSSNSPCGPGDKVVLGSQYGIDKLGYLNPAGGDLGLQPGAPGINAGDPGDYPATDINGTKRPLGGLPDAGANEAG